MHALILGAAIIVATNAVALIGVGYNRSGEPESVLQLTERELQLINWNLLDNNNSGIDLHISWRMKPSRNPSGESMSRNYWNHDLNWLTERNLRELGFDFAQTLQPEHEASYYSRMLPREVLLVLEYDGPAYQTALAMARQKLQDETDLALKNEGKEEFSRRAKNAADALQTEEQYASRLFVVDAGRDIANLREQYPDRKRYAIVRGLVRLIAIESTAKRVLTATVSQLSIESVSVPHNYRKLVEPLIGSDIYNANNRPPRYAVTMNIGRRLEPWIMELSRL